MRARDEVNTNINMNLALQLVICSILKKGGQLFKACTHDRVRDAELGKEMLMSSKSKGGIASFNRSCIGFFC
jgi:hypothetical protein